MFDVVLVLVALLSLVYYYLTWHHSYWQNRGVFTLPGALPGVGHMKDALLLKKSAGWLHCDAYDEGKGHAAVGMYLFRQPALVVRDPHLVQAVLVREFSSFHDNPIESDEKIDSYAAKNPFTLKGQAWKNLRLKLAPAMSPTRIKSMFPLIERVCQEFNKYIETRQHEDIDVNHVAGLFTSEVVAKVAFGIDGNAFNDINAEFYKMGRQIWDGLIYNPLVMLMLFFFPVINKIVRKPFFPKEVVDFFSSLIQQTVDHRAGSGHQVPDDYLQYLINLQQKDPEFTMHDIVSQSLTFFTDGFETSAITASFMIYELTRNPEVQEQLRQELRAMDAFTFDNITALPLLEAVLFESMRIHSVLSLSRECTKDCVLEAGGEHYPVRQGQQIVIPAYGIHHDAEFYPEPDKFDPGRFLSDNAKTRPPCTYLGFGAGPRICFGNRFASCQVKVLVANIILNFRLVTCAKTRENMEYNKKHVLPMAKDGIWVRFQKI